MNVKDEDLTHKFTYAGKTCLVGKFDPSAYPTLSDKPLVELSQEIFDQVEDSKVFTEAELDELSALGKRQFRALVTSR